MTPTSPPLPLVIEVVLQEPEVDWYDLTDIYVETYWLPAVGPTCWAVARRMFHVGVAAGYAELVEHETEILGRMVGVGVSQLSSALWRLTRFGLSDWLRIGDVPLLSLRSTWPPLPRRHADRFSDFLPVPE